jgi:hypothetical protein
MKLMQKSEVLKRMFLPHSFPASVRSGYVCVCVLACLRSSSLFTILIVLPHYTTLHRYLHYSFYQLAGSVLGGAAAVLSTQVAKR